MFNRKNRWHYVSVAWDLLLHSHGITQTRLAINDADGTASIECLGTSVLLLSWSGRTLMIGVSLDCNPAVVAWFMQAVGKYHTIQVSKDPFISTTGGQLWGAEAIEYAQYRELLSHGDHGEVIALAKNREKC